MIGKTISHYRILEKLGEGGMGVVYKAQDTKLDRLVALKFLPRHLLCDEDAKARFVQEAKAASALNHTNITTIYEIDEVEGECFICMEYIEGKSIKEVIKEKTLSIEEILKIGIQIAEGLNAAHKKGIVHRDIKSDNIMLNDEGLVKIMDFGLAKLKGVSRVTKAGTTLGTVSYMSPEQARGEEVDHRTDIWSLGVVLYEMLTGELPFKGEYEQAVIYAILNEKPNPITDLRTDLPGELEPIVNKALAKSLDSRYQKAENILVDLRKLRKELELMASKEETSARKFQPSIAVLPFANLSADPEQEYFCDGMADEIINGLTHIEGLRVVARTSTFAFKGKHEDIREIGRKLNVETLLEGSVRKVGNRLRITAQLVNVADGYHLWSEKYDRNVGEMCCPEDIFAIQDDISLAIVDNLKLKLLGKEKDVLLKRYTDNLEAYDLYLKGRYFWNKRTEKDLRKSIECFNQAIEKDSNYALAYAGLADSFIVLPDYSSTPPKEAFPHAKLQAIKALELDNTLAEAYASLAMIKSSFDWDWEGGERDFRRAIQLNLGYATAHHWYAMHLMHLARFDESQVDIKKALELDPLSLPINLALGQLFYYSRQYDQAIKQIQKVIEMDPVFSHAHTILGLAYLGKSMYEEALREFQNQKELLTSWNPMLEYSFGVTYALMGKRSAAEEVLRQMIEASKLSYVPPCFIAMVAGALGNEEQMFTWLEKAYEERDSFLRFLKIIPAAEGLRSDLRFKSLLKKMGLEK